MLPQANVRVNIFYEFASGFASGTFHFIMKR